MINEIDIEEFFRRIDLIVPGGICNDSKINLPVSQVKFSKLSINDLDDIHSYSINKKLYEFLEYEPFKTIDETKNFLNKLLLRMKKNNGIYDAYYWSVRDKSDNSIIGTASISNINYNRQSIEWGYAIDPQKWGHGYIYDIQELLKHYIFDILKINRLYGLTMLKNERTISSLKAAGMKQDGVLRQSHFKGNEFHDGWKYSMLKYEYLNDYIIDDKNKLQNNQNTKYDINIEDIVRLVSHVINEEDLDVNTSMTITPKWDSLSHMIIVETLCEKYNCEIKPKDIHKLSSIKKIYSFLRGI